MDLTSDSSLLMHFALDFLRVYLETIETAVVTSLCYFEREKSVSKCMLSVLFVVAVSVSQCDK